nr:hypothetical protein [Paraburkholderia sp. BL8N3]
MQVEKREPFRNGVDDLKRVVIASALVHRPARVVEAALLVLVGDDAPLRAACEKRAYNCVGMRRDCNSATENGVVEVRRYD